MHAAAAPGHKLYIRQLKAERNKTTTRVTSTHASFFCALMQSSLLLKIAKKLKKDLQL